MVEEKTFKIDSENYIAAQELSEEDFILVEKPHMRKVKAYIATWRNLSRWIDDGSYGAYFENWAVDNSYVDRCPQCDDEGPREAWRSALYSNKEALLDYAGHDFSGLDKIDTIEEAAKYCQDGPGYHHQRREAMVAVQELCFKKIEEDEDGLES